MQAAAPPWPVASQAPRPSRCRGMAEGGLAGQQQGLGWAQAADEELYEHVQLLVELAQPEQHNSSSSATLQRHTLGKMVMHLAEHT